MIKDLNIQEAKDMIESNKDNKNFLILDVRTPEEYKAGHIKDAINIDIYRKDFEEKISQLNKDEKYLIHCRSGVRGCDAKNIMEDLGFKEVYHMHEGILGWEEKGFPLIQ